jgi:hypothetical protein
MEKCPYFLIFSVRCSARSGPRTGRALRLPDVRGRVHEHGGDGPTGLGLDLVATQAVLGRRRVELRLSAQVSAFLHFILLIFILFY